MHNDRRARLIDAGWTIVRQRHIGIDITGKEKGDDRYCTWRAAKGDDEVVVRAMLGDDQTALIELYAAAKAIDPELRQIAVDAGSGAYVFDLGDADPSHRH